MDTSYYKKFTVDKKLSQITSDIAEKYATKETQDAIQNDLRHRIDEINETIKIEKAQSRKQNSEIDKIK